MRLLPRHAGSAARRGQTASRIDFAVSSGLSASRSIIAVSLRSRFANSATSGSGPPFPSVHVVITDSAGAAGHLRHIPHVLGKHLADERTVEHILDSNDNLDTKRFRVQVKHR